jgi:hypothetical protein
VAFESDNLNISDTKPDETLLHETQNSSDTEVFVLSGTIPISLRVDSGKIPLSIEGSNPLEFFSSITLEQISGSDTFKEIVNEIIKGYDEASNDESRDQDGDGIPDNLDKHPNQTVADVAAQKLGIGKYSKKNKQSMFFSFLKKFFALIKSKNFPIGMLASLEKKSEDKQKDDDDENSLFGKVEGKNSSDGVS